MNSLRISIVAGCLILAAACSKEPPPRTVSEFMENKILLEATMVRCSQDRSKTKYDAECVSAREAANRLEVMAQQARQKELEARSEAKRQALRRTQEAVADARRRAAEAQRLREEAAYLSQFDTTPDGGDGQVGQGEQIPQPTMPAGQPGGQPELSTSQQAPQPQPESAPPQAPANTAGDLGAIREELKRRQDKPQ